MDIGLKDLGGRQATVEAMVDDGAMVAAMDANIYEGLRNEIGGWTTMQRKFRMANGTVVPGKARWAGHINVKGVEVDGEFEVFDSGSSWKFLFEKPLLKRFSAVHDYGKESIVLHGKRGNWKEVFNGRLGEVVTPNATPAREEQSQRDIPRPNAIAQVVLEESAEPAGGVTVKALTPLDREVNELHLVQKNFVTNDAGQYKPKVMPSSRRHAPQIEEVPDEEPTQTQTEPGVYETVLEWNTDVGRGEEQLTEAELEDWLRQTERQPIWEEEEERREADWVAWLRRQRAEPGLRKWFFWRNRFNAPPLWEVSADAGSTVEHHIDLVSTERQTHDATNPIVEPTSDVRRREEMGDITKNMPDGSRVDSVGGFDVPPSREVLSEDSSADPQHADRSQTVPICILQNEEDYPSQSEMGLDFFPDALDQSEDINLFTRNDGEKGAFRPEQREYLHAKIDELLEAGVIERCNPEDVRCVSPLTLAQKAHEGAGLTVEELMHKLNDECVAAGLPGADGTHRIT
ncbi:hypothetical protein EV368DRAFT_87603 [Lentinula lateritia]|nr:hypothetical protein EV368DRAFT_87603 [Lentinula lateritia]